MAIESSLIYPLNMVIFQFAICWLVVYLEQYENKWKDYPIYCGK